METENVTQAVQEVAKKEGKLAVFSFLLKNPYALTLAIVAIGLIIWAIFKKGKSDENVAIPEIKIDDVSTNTDLGKTEKERVDFSLKASKFAKRVYDLTSGWDPGVLVNENAKLKATLYGEMIKLNKTQMTLVNDRWIDNFFAKKSESMYSAIDSDHHWWTLSPANEKALLKLLVEYELNDD